MSPLEDKEPRMGDRQRKKAFAETEAFECDLQGVTMQLGIPKTALQVEPMI